MSNFICFKSKSGSRLTALRAADLRADLCLILLTVSLVAVPMAFAGPINRLTVHEAQVRPYLLSDVRHYDEYPSDCWQLFGLNEAEIKNRYCNDKALLTKAEYTPTKGGGNLYMNWGKAGTTIKVVYKLGRVVSVTSEDENKYNEPAGSKSFSSRTEALNAALKLADKEVANLPPVSADHNIGFSWSAYRNRARILLALGRNADATKDIRAAEKLELQILKNPKAAQTDNRPLD